MNEFLGGLDNEEDACRLLASFPNMGRKAEKMKITLDNKHLARILQEFASNHEGKSHQHTLTIFRTHILFIDNRETNKFISDAECTNAKEMRF